MKRILKVHGMKCEGCSEAIEKALEKFVEIDLAKAKKAIEDLGYEVEDYEGVE